jgi:hypothetical protein
MADDRATGVDQLVGRADDHDLGISVEQCNLCGQPLGQGNVVRMLDGDVLPASQSEAAI